MFLSHGKLFEKIKRCLELVFLPHFLYLFEEKYFSCNILLIDQVSLSGCSYFVRYWAICLLQLFVNQVVTSWILKQEVQGLQAFAFSVVTVNDEHTKSVEVKFKAGISAKLCLKLWFESDWYFSNITRSGWFWKRLSSKKS